MVENLENPDVFGVFDSDNDQPFTVLPYNSGIFTEGGKFALINKEE